MCPDGSYIIEGLSFLSLLFFLNSSFAGCILLSGSHKKPQYMYTKGMYYQGSTYQFNKSGVENPNVFSMSS